VEIEHVKSPGTMKITGVLKSARLMYLKGFLFLVIGVLCVATLLLELTFQNAVLLVLAIWSFCRFYYFQFYVIEKYVDGEFRFAGVWSFLVYLWKKRRQKRS